MADRFELFSTSVLKLTRAVQAIKSSKMAEHGLKGPDAVCLCRLYECEGGLTATELARAGEIDKAQVSRAMSALLARGLVLLEQSEEKRYKRKYRLTAEGVRVSADVAGTVARIERAVAHGIPPRELDVFYATLYKLCRNFDGLLAEEGRGVNETL